MNWYGSGIERGWRKEQAMAGNIQGEIVMVHDHEMTAVLLFPGICDEAGGGAVLHSNPRPA